MRLKLTDYAKCAVEFRSPKPITEILQLKNGDTYPICPRCSISLDREYMNYCDRCGQRLDWKHLKKAQIVYPGRPLTHI